MISVSDILKVLDQIPIRKHVRELPKRMEALEKRVAELEAGARKTIPPGRECPKCGQAMTVVREGPDVVLGRAGVMNHILECACGFRTERKFRPGSGYM
jgi:hypothetical protein